MKLGAFQIGAVVDGPQPWGGACRVQYCKDDTVPAVFAKRCAAVGEALAIVGDGCAITYRELDARSDALAHWLLARGLGPEALVAIVLPRSADAIVAMLASLKAGCAYLPLAEDLPMQRARVMLDDSGAGVLIGRAEHADALRSWRGDREERTILLIDAEEASPSTGEYSWYDVDRHLKAGHVDRSRPGGLAYVMYTSGTTGKPKGVMVEHRAILRLVIDTDYIRLGAADRVLQTGQLSFDASTFEIWGALLNGGALCIARHEELLDPDALARLIQRHRVTVMFLTTGLFNMMATLRPDMFAYLGTLIYGGERSAPVHANRIRRRFPSLAIKHAYGPTENTTFTTIFDVLVEHDHDIPIGHAIARTSIHVLDDELREVAPGAPGELYVGGDGLARGYLNDPELTAERFVLRPLVPGERLYRTGDLGRRRADGAVEFLGRTDDQIKLHGFRVEPAEIERCLCQMAELRDVVVVAAGDAAEERALVAYYVADKPIADEAMRRQVAEQLPPHMVPASFVHRSRLPLTINGKVDRRALSQSSAAYEARPRADVDVARAAETETEAALRMLWIEVLQRGDLTLDDNFFDHGGHSLKAVKLAHLITERLEVSVPFTLLFETPTVRTMAAAIVEAAAGDGAIEKPLVALSVGASCVYACPPGTADALSYADLATRLEGWAIKAFNFLPRSDAASFADLIVEDGPEQPVCLLGYSGGGNFAFRTACELERRAIKVAAVVMFDASRFVDHFVFPPSEARRLAAAFVETEAVKAHLSSAPLRDRIVRRIEDYYAALQATLDTGRVQADLHLILCEDGSDAYREEGGHLVCSKSAWAEATHGRFVSHAGRGPHERMLMTPYLEQNVAILQSILASIRDGTAARAGGR